MTLAARKAVAREEAALRRAAAHDLHRAAASDRLRAHLSEQAGRVIAGYLPIRSEADPLPTMEALAARNRVVVPVVTVARQPLVFREWRPGCRLVQGVFGVMVPADGAELVPDLVIAPLLAFDRKMHRLGYGGGFYDRTLAQLRKNGRIEALGFAYAAQGVAAVPVEVTDEPLDAVLTESGVVPLAP